jgi:lysine 2,3-aminomutase
MRDTLRTPADLVGAGLVAPEAVPELDVVARRYAVAISPTLARLVDPGDPQDPITRQFVPDVRELETRPEELADPIGDAAKSPIEGIVHRYPDRVLLKLVHVCPVYCRFCFRREVVGPEGAGTLGSEALAKAIAYIAGQPAVREVILTGGDPLMLSARRIAEVGRMLVSLPHVELVRWHTRVPIATPERVTPEVVEALGVPRASGRAVWMAVHVNHARELGADAVAALDRLAAGRIGLVSQSVLLRGVNDDAEVLAELFRALLRSGVKPYYLHHPDLAPGTAHFRLSIEEGRQIVGALRGRLSGLAIPAYILDIPGGHGKVPIDPVHTVDEEGVVVAVRAPDGSRHPIAGGTPSPQSSADWARI